MRSLLDFLKYHNAIPILLAVVILGAGTAFAVSPGLRQAAFAPAISVSGPPVPTDTARLRAADLAKFDLALRIDKLTEDAEAYHVDYSYTTLEVTGGEWREVRKDGKMDIYKGILGERDLKTYLIGQLGQVIDRELAYLSEAKKAALPASEARTSSKYASLVGTGIDEGMREEAEKDAISVGDDTAESVSSAETDSEVSVGGLSREEINDMIVDAVADFLAVDVSMPEPLSGTGLSGQEATPPHAAESVAAPEGGSEAPAEIPAETSETDPDGGVAP